jgi:hypothetical protein
MFRCKTITVTLFKLSVYEHFFKKKNHLLKQWLCVNFGNKSEENH